jgi:catechol 2,3-dioxygenase-like lactoylglutathione lyase family enzyme
MVMATSLRGSLVALAGLMMLAQSGPAFADNVEQPLQIAGPVLIVENLDRALEFYTHGLGMTIASRLPGNPGPGAVLVADAGQKAPFILLRQREKLASAGPPADVSDRLSRIMLNVGDAAAVSARLKTAGYPAPAPNAKGIFFVTDPDGYRYEVMEAGRKH